MHYFFPKIVAPRPKVSNQKKLEVLLLINLLILHGVELNIGLSFDGWMQIRGKRSLWACKCNLVFFPCMRYSEIVTRKHPQCNQPTFPLCYCFIVIFLARLAIKGIYLTFWIVVWDGCKRRSLIFYKRWYLIGN